MVGLSGRACEALHLSFEEVFTAITSLSYSNLHLRHFNLGFIVYYCELKLSKAPSVKPSIYLFSMFSGLLRLSWSSFAPKPFQGSRSQCCGELLQLFFIHTLYFSTSFFTTLSSVQKATLFSLMSTAKAFPSYALSSTFQKRL